MVGAAEPDWKAEHIPPNHSKGQKTEGATGVSITAEQLREGQRHQHGAGEGCDWEGMSLLLVDITGGHSKMAHRKIF